MIKRGKGLQSVQRAVRRKTTIGGYIYAIIVDGVVRYIGKGRNGRMYTHLIEAKCTSARCPAETAHLYPRKHRKLVETVRAGSQIIETVITSGLTDRAAYRLESRMIGEFHKFRAGQLWNTIDERFIDPRYLPDEWDDPENPLYRLPRPLGKSSTCQRLGKVENVLDHQSISARLNRRTANKKPNEPYGELHATKNNIIRIKSRGWRHGAL
jgi:hypothetical protein